MNPRRTRRPEPSRQERDRRFLRLALRLARRGCGATSPNPMVGAVLVRRGQIIGRGWHRRAGGPHAEIEALQQARQKGQTVKGATLYVTLEPCSTQGRTPPCTESLKAAGLRRVVIGATDPNPRHRGRAFAILRRAGIAVTSGILARECAQLNEAFNHWIVRRVPFVTVKAAMTLDGKIATATGESRWITGGPARAWGMKLRQEADAILVGINTVMADNPRLTVRPRPPGARRAASAAADGRLRRIVLDARARTPLSARVVSDAWVPLTTIVVGASAPPRRVAALARRVRVLVAPASRGQINLPWLLRRLGAENVTHLLVEGGGEVNASFLLSGLAQRVVFFYAPKILGGRGARRAVAGEGARARAECLRLTEVEWRRLGADWRMSARVAAA